MEQCQTCGYTVPLRQQMRVGAIVEIGTLAAADLHGALAIILGQMDLEVSPLMWEVVALTGPSKGTIRYCDTRALSVVHGFIHIARRADWDTLPPAGLADSTGCYY
mgnify:CR=1 FL=1